MDNYNENRERVIVRDGHRYYNNIVNIYTASKNVEVDRKCIRYQFTNVGDTIATVNGMIIYPGVPGTSLGDSRSISGFENDLYRGNIEVSFIVPIGVAPAVEIVQIVLMTN